MARPERVPLRAMRVAILPLAAIIWLVSLGGGIRRVAWKAVYEPYDFGRRQLRLLHHRLIVRPARAVRRFVILSWRRVAATSHEARRNVNSGARQAGRRSAAVIGRVARNGRVAAHRLSRATLRAARLARRQTARVGAAVLRRLRSVRYQVALRLRGADGDEAGSREL